MLKNSLNVVEHGSVVNSQLKVIKLNAGNLQQYIDYLAELRIEIFRSWPYLYDGKKDYEYSYLKKYIESKNALLIIVLDGNKPVGASSAILLKDCDEEITGSFLKNGLDLNQYMYFGESVLHPDYRNTGMGRVFMDLRQEFALQYKNVRFCTFASIERDPLDPRKPVNYRGLEDFWQRIGFIRQEDLFADFIYPSYPEGNDLPHRMHFWTKTIRDKDMKMTSRLVVEAYYKAFNEKNIPAFLDLLCDDVIHDINNGERQVGKKLFADFMNAYSEYYAEEVKNLCIFEAAQKNRIAAEFTVTGTYLKTAPGLPKATQQNYILPCGAFFEIENNKVKRITCYYSLNDWLTQISA